VTQILQTRYPEVDEHDGTAPPSLDLLRVLDEVEQAIAPREVLPQRHTPAPTRTPRPFAYD
jgi:hypothetical protein